MYTPKNIPAFYVLLNSGAIAVSVHILFRGPGGHSSVCFCPEEGVTESIFSGSESDAMRFHRHLLNEMSDLTNYYFPVIDMRGFRSKPDVREDLAESDKESSPAITYHHSEISS